jgi:hypothetical protein
MIYVYAITDPAPAAAPPDVRGLDDAAIATRTSGAVAAVYTVHDLRQITPTPENLWRHEAVVESIMRRCDAVLPARFGTVFADENAIDDILTRHAAPLAAGLTRVRGWVELGLREGLPITADFVRETFGMTNPSIFRKLLGESVAEHEILRYGDLKEESYRGLAAGQIVLMDGVRDLIDGLTAKGFRLVLRPLRRDHAKK